MSSRLASLVKNIPPQHCWLLTNPHHIRYLTGFECLVPEEREAYLLLTTSGAYLQHARFSAAPVVQPLLHISTPASEGSLLSLLSTQCSPSTTLAVELEGLTAREYLWLTRAGYKPVALEQTLLWNQRLIKDSTEITHLRKAGHIAAKAWDRWSSQVKTGITEQEACRLLEIALLEAGSEKIAFPTIVAFGSHSALPHHQPTTRTLAAEEPVLVDFGAMVAGYRSDMTRTWWHGSSPSDTFQKVKTAVLTAYEVGYQRLNQRPLTANQLDIAVRSSIEAAGYGPHFIHTSGHGIGLDIHELPSLYQASKPTIELQSDMVITLEPGVYLTEKTAHFGYRYENTLWIQRTGLTSLTASNDVLLDFPPQRSTIT